MPTFSYALSSSLIFFPFILAAILDAAVNSRHNYGEWLSIGFLVVFSIVIFRILNKELSITSIVEASKKFRISKSGIDASMSKDAEGTTIFRSFKYAINFPGWVLSYLIFPTSNAAFYVGVILLLLTFIISVSVAMGVYSELSSTSSEAIGVGVGSFFFVLIIFFSLRNTIDTKLDEDLGKVS